jgi:hypothetical protein
MYRTRQGLGLNCPGDPGCPGNLMPVTAVTGIVWTDCPDGSTVPAEVGCPSYGQTITTLLNDNAGKIAIGAAVFLGLMLFTKAGR